MILANLSLTYFRWIVVCFPFYSYHREIVTNNPKFPQRWPLDFGRIVKYGTGVFVFAILFCLPNFFDYEMPSCPCKSTIYPRDKTRLNPYYIWTYTIVIDLILRYVFPVGILFYANLRYVLKVLWLG